jgi:hypothetical protein
VPRSAATPPVSPFGATVQCRECEVFIGVGHHDATPLGPPDGHGAVGPACYAALLRQVHGHPVDWRSVEGALKTRR